MLAEIAIREGHEDGRQNTADSKLTSALAVLPLIITLSTAAFFGMLPYASRIGGLGIVLVVAFVFSVVSFGVAAVFAIQGLSPRRGTYSVVGLRTILRYMNARTYPEMLREMIHERADAVRADGAVNGKKLGFYMAAARWTTAGFVSLILVVIGFVLVMIVEPAKLMGSSSARPSPSRYAPSSSRPTPSPQSASKMPPKRQR